MLLLLTTVDYHLLDWITELLFYLYNLLYKSNFINVHFYDNILYR